MARNDRRRSTAKADNYTDFSRPLPTVTSHQVLAIDRGEELGTLRARITLSDTNKSHVLASMERHWLGQVHQSHHNLMRDALSDALSRLIHPRLERALRRRLREKAHAVALARLYLHILVCLFLFFAV